MKLILKATAPTPITEPIVAAPKGEDAYWWYEYTAPRASNFTTTNGKRTLRLKQGDEFGLRWSHDRKKARMIVRDYPTIVFTMTPDEAGKLEDKASRKRN